MTRRDFARWAGLAAAAAIEVAAVPALRALPTTFGGVRLGVCLYDFRDMSRPANEDAYVDKFVDACRQVGVGLVEINAPYLEPPTLLPYAGIPRLWDEPLTGAQAEAFARLSAAEVAEERERQRQWRFTTPLSFFSGVGAKFRAAGLEPYSYVMTFTPDMTEAEIDAILRHAPPCARRRSL